MTVAHNKALNRYELKTEHGLALAVYHQQGDRRIFTHTEVPIEDEGKGHASRLVKETTRAGPASRSSRPAASW
jgi:predicted GNAT family acetyltransferase